MSIRREIWTESRGLALLFDALTKEETYDTANHSVVTVGTTSVTVLNPNPNRIYALFINDSDTAIYLKFGSPAALNEGIRLNGNGGCYEISKKIGNLYKSAVYAITSVANRKLLVLEGE